MDRDRQAAVVIELEGIWMKRIRHIVVTIKRDIDVAVIRLSGRVRPAPAPVPIRRPGHPRQR